MRRIRVTGGYTDVLEADLSAQGGLVGATVQGLLVEETAPQPAADAPGWVAVVLDEATVSLSVTESTPVGYFNLWLQVVAAGGVRTLLLVLDADGLPLLIRVQ